jgi:hypothetical protein
MATISDQNKLPIETLEESRFRRWIRIVIGASGTAVWIALASWSYSAAMAGDMIFAGVLLVFATVLGVAALMVSEWYRTIENRFRKRLNWSLAGGLAIVSGVLFWWEFEHRSTLPTFPTADEVASKVVEKLPTSEWRKIPPLPWPDQPKLGNIFKDVFISGANTGIKIIGGGNNSFECLHIDNTENPIVLENTAKNKFNDVHINNNKDCKQ